MDSQDDFSDAAFALGGAGDPGLAPLGGPDAGDDDDDAFNDETFGVDVDAAEDFDFGHSALVREHEEFVRQAKEKSVPAPAEDIRVAQKAIEHAPPSQYTGPALPENANRRAVIMSAADLEAEMMRTPLHPTDKAGAAAAGGAYPDRLGAEQANIWAGHEDRSRSLAPRGPEAGGPFSHGAMAGSFYAPPPQEDSAMGGATAYASGSAPGYQRDPVPAARQGQAHTLNYAGVVGAGAGSAPNVVREQQRAPAAAWGGVGQPAGQNPAVFACQAGAAHPGARMPLHSGVREGAPNSFAPGAEYGMPPPMHLRDFAYHGGQPAYGHGMPAMSPAEAARMNAEALRMQHAQAARAQFHVANMEAQRYGGRDGAVGGRGGRGRGGHRAPPLLHPQVRQFGIMTAREIETIIRVHLSQNASKDPIDDDFYATHFAAGSSSGASKPGAAGEGDSSSAASERHAPAREKRMLENILGRPQGLFIRTPRPVLDTMVVSDGEQSADRGAPSSDVTSESRRGAAAVSLKAVSALAEECFAACIDHDNEVRQRPNNRDDITSESDGTRRVAQLLGASSDEELETQAFVAQASALEAEARARGGLGTLVPSDEKIASLVLLPKGRRALARILSIADVRMCNRIVAAICRSIPVFVGALPDLSATNALAEAIDALSTFPVAQLAAASDGLTIVSAALQVAGNVIEVLCHEVGVVLLQRLLDMAQQSKSDATANRASPAAAAQLTRAFDCLFGLLQGKFSELIATSTDTTLLWQMLQVVAAFASEQQRAIMLHELNLG